MYNIIGDSFDEENGVRVLFVQTKIRQDLRDIRNTLYEIAENEAKHLFRLARRMEEHGCNRESINTAREEAREIRAYPEKLIHTQSHNRWKYAFKI